MSLRKRNVLFKEMKKIFFFKNKQTMFFYSMFYSYSMFFPAVCSVAAVCFFLQYGSSYSMFGSYNMFLPTVWFFLQNVWFSYSMFLPTVCFFLQYVCLPTVCLFSYSMFVFLQYVSFLANF